MERAIGEVFEFDGDKYIVEEGESCDNCGFDKVECCDDSFDEIIGECANKYRKDNKSVIFVKIVD